MTRVLSSVQADYAIFFIRTHFIRTSKLRLGKKNKNKLRTKWSLDHVQEEIRKYIKNFARCFLKIMFSYGAQCAGTFLKFLSFPSELWNFQLFQQARCEVIAKYINYNLLEHDWIRTLEAQIEWFNVRICIFKRENFF